MSSEDHPELKIARQLIPDLPEGRDVLYETIALTSATLSPEQRMAFLQKVDQEILADESPLRQKAQLMAMRRHLTQMDDKLRRAKR